jgi:peroxiredoxin Q/BCP
MLTIGSKAPDFTLRSQTGEEVRLYDLLARRHVVLYFYIRDATPG